MMSLDTYLRLVQAFGNNTTYFDEERKTGRITKEEYMARMEKGKTRLLELEQKKKEVEKELDSMMKIDRTEEVQEEELSELSVLETFDKEKIQILVDKVFVYDSDAIEIVWKISNPFE